MRCVLMGGQDGCSGDFVVEIWELNEIISIHPFCPFVYRREPTSGARPRHSLFRSTTLSVVVILASEVSGSPNRGATGTSLYACYSARGLIAGIGKSSS